MVRLPRRRSRSILCALVAGAAALALAACGNDADAGGADRRTITDADGAKVEVPVLPQRVVVLSEPLLDGALAVGLRPLATTGARDRSDVSSYLTRQARGVVAVGPRGRPNVDHVEALAPDLILLDGTSAVDDTTVRALRRIAPTARVAQSGQDWRAAFAAQADALNRRKEAAHVLHELDGRVAQVRGALGAHAGARVGVARWSGAGAPAAIDAPAADRMLADLGLARATDGLHGDWLFLDAPGDNGDDGDARAARRALRAARDVPGLAASKAVRKGHVVPVDGSAWSSAGGPIAEREVVDDVARALGR